MAAMQRRLPSLGGGAGTAVATLAAGAGGTAGTVGGDVALRAAGNEDAARNPCAPHATDAALRRDASGAATLRAARVACAACAAGPKGAADSATAVCVAGAAGATRAVGLPGAVIFTAVVGAGAAGAVGVVGVTDRGLDQCLLEQACEVSHPARANFRS